MPDRHAQPRPRGTGFSRGRRVRRRWRQFLAVGLCLLAASLVLRDRDAGVPAVRAQEALPAGHVVSETDLEVVRIPASLRPAGAITTTSELVGATLGSTVGVGEFVTAARLEPGVEPDADARVVSVPIPDAGTLTLLRPGSVVDVLAAHDSSFRADPAPPQYGTQPHAPLQLSPRILVESATVVEVPRDKRGEPAGTVALSVRREDAAPLAAAALSTQLGVSIAR